MINTTKFPPEKFIVEAKRCEEHNCWHFYMADDGIELLKKLLAQIGVEFVVEEIRDHYNFGDGHRLHQAIRAIFEVQGQKYDEGMEVVGMIESLVAKYAELK